MGNRVHIHRTWGETLPAILDKLYFQSVYRERYKFSNPWLNSVLPFDECRGLKVLEIGVGEGDDLVRFAANGAICSGADIVDRHLDLTKRNLATHRLSADLKKCDAVDLSFPDNHFDLVYSIGVLHHIPEKERALNEMRRVLKPGGTLICAVYRKWSAFYLFQKLLFDGLIGKKLFELGYRGLLATIERPADGDNVKPFVELYTKEKMEDLISGIGMTLINLKVCHLQPSHFGSLEFLYSKWLEKYLGWYLVTEAKK